MNFPSLSDAEAYLKNKIQDFYNQNQVLHDRIVSIAKLKKAARERNDQGALGQLILMDSQARALQMEYLQLRETLAPFASFFNIQLGALPLLLAGGAIAAAGAMYLFYQKLDTQKKALDLVARGFLTPAEADALVNPSFLGSLASAGGIAFLPLILAGGFMLFLFVRK
jgi:hypothetical protein